MGNSCSAAQRILQKGPQAKKSLPSTFTLCRNIFRVDYEQSGSYTQEKNRSVFIVSGVAQDTLTWTGFGPLSVSPFALTGYDPHTGILAIGNCMSCLSAS